MKDLQNEKIRLLEEYIGLYKTKPNPMLARQTWIKCVNNVEQRLSTLTERINSEPKDASGMPSDEDIHEFVNHYALEFIDRNTKTSIAFHAIQLWCDRLSGVSEKKK